MKKTVFVSRTISPSSPIQTVVDQYSALLTATSLIQFQDIPFQLPETEWLFFYSKTGVQSFFNSALIQSTSKKFKIACYGPATAEYCAQYQSVDYIGNLDADQVAKDIISCIKKNEITFICGKHSLRAVQHNLSLNSFRESIVYDHYPKSNCALARYDVAILTSPMNVHAFFDNQGMADYFISIGQTTAKTLKDYELDFVISERPDESALAESLKKYLALN